MAQQRIYVAAIFDAPGVAAANNFMAFFMPATSKKFAVALNVTCVNYATGPSNTPDSMTISRITSASGGTLVAANMIPRFVDTDDDPALQVFTGNPTVSTGRVPFVGYPPPISGAGGTGSEVSQQAPGGASFVIPPGTGLVFNTAAGNTAQMWNLQFIWTESYLPPSS